MPPIVSEVLPHPGKRRRCACAGGVAATVGTENPDALAGIRTKDGSPSLVLLSSHHCGRRAVGYNAVSEGGLELLSGAQHLNAS